MNINIGLKRFQQFLKKHFLRVKGLQRSALHGRLGKRRGYNEITAVTDQISEA